MGQAQRDEKGHFLPGNTMNPGRTAIADGGKPNKVKQARELIEDQLEQVIQAMIDCAMKGDTSAGKLVISLCMPSLKQTELSVSDISKLPRLVVETNVIDAIDVDTVEPTEKQEKP